MVVKFFVGWLVVRQNKCFYGTRIKTECSIPYVITRFDEDHLDKMSHFVRTVRIICPLLGVENIIDVSKEFGL